MNYRYGPVNECLSEWKNVYFNSNENIPGRSKHTSVTYKNKIITFGGCLMYNKKRNIRECLN
jgi:hypothetical protein